MRMMLLVAMAGVTMAWAGGSVLAQTTALTMTKPHTATGERPIDKGPFTAEANRAYQGGGVVLEGAPGAPAPRPEPTPPGQTPRNAVQ